MMKAREYSLGYLACETLLESNPTAARLIAERLTDHHHPFTIGFRTALAVHDEKKAS